MQTRNSELTTRNDQFNGTIGPANLLSLVRNTAPFLFDGTIRWDDRASVPSTRLIDLANHPLGFLDILERAETLPAVDNPSTAQREDYFALCMACHHATVATFVPTDVDTKIRGVLWQQREDPEALRRMFDFTLQAMKWDVSRISTRWSAWRGVGPVSGHNGEMLGVLAGALGGLLKNGDAESAERAAQAIDDELKREAQEFRYVLEFAERGRPLPLPPPSRGGENNSGGPPPLPRPLSTGAGNTSDAAIELLKLATSLTHNCGDLDQGISFWSNRDVYAPYRARFGRLAHENRDAYDGTFQIAAKLYKAVMSAEGHRHYPLREVRCLRRSPDFLLPLGPFFDDWGATIGRHKALNTDERAEVLAALISGCKKIANQQGYFRAISGMAEALGGEFENVAKRMPAALRNELKNNAEIRRQIALKKISFESSMKKKALAAL
ncbi:MAG TPA: hypothetical protein VEJ63_17665 [Planctomycetota bacterium]|nr:hypothetical protein [Planctomycetota bacterium]